MDQRVETNLSWAGGFFDGEGHAALNRTSLMAQVSQSAADGIPPDLAAFVEIVGVGRVRGPFQYGGGRKPCYEWRVYGNNARVALASLLPFLRGPKAIRVKELLDG